MKSTPSPRASSSASRTSLTEASEVFALSRRELLGALALGGSGLLWGLPELRAATPPAPRPTIGVIGPLTGKYSALGKRVELVAQLAGTDVGVTTLSSDTRGEPQDAARMVAELAARPEVLAIVGPLGQRESRAAAVAAQRAGVPLFALSSVEGIEATGPWIHRLRPTPAEQAEALARGVLPRLRAQTFGILYPDNAYGQQASVAFARAVVGARRRVTAIAGYDPNLRDMRKALDQLCARRWRTGTGKGADPDGYTRTSWRKTRADFDALFIPDFHPNIARTLPFLPGIGLQTGEAQSEGRAVQLLGLSGWQGQSMAQTGAHAAGAIIVDAFGGETDGGQAQEFARLFEGKTGMRPVNLDAEVFDAVFMLGSIVRRVLRAHPTDWRQVGRSRVVQWLPRAKAWHGLCGGWQLDAQGRPLRAMRLYRFDIDGATSPL